MLSGGRLRLGVEIGWNAVEFEPVGEEEFGDWSRRGVDQIEVMRALWTKELVAIDGRWHCIVDAGINPLPVQRPIPFREAARTVGRDASAIGPEGAIPFGSGDPPDSWRADLATWQSLGATHVTLQTRRDDLSSPAAHVVALRRMVAALRAG